MVAITLGSGIMVGTVIGARKVADPPAAPLFLEQTETAGTDPFVPLAQPAPAAPGSPGSSDVGRCDPETLVAYLAAHRAQAQAWVDALNSDPALRWSGGSRVSVEQIPAYVAQLRPVRLSNDLRVTNHQFTGGRAVGVQSVLQQGTAVLVDAAGVARVRCACGNPLAPMRKITAPPRYVGVPWSGFTPVRVEVTVINRTEVDVKTRERCGRDEYFDGDRCRPIDVCPPGLDLGADGRCYYPIPPCPPGFEPDEESGSCTPAPTTLDCPEGAERLPDGTCPAPPVTCAEGTTVPAGDACPEPEQTCPNGAVPASGTCPEPVRTCPDGSTAPAGQICPEPVQTCPDGSTAPAGRSCPDPVQTCPGGSTVPMSDRCPEPVETCPDGSTVPAGELCPEPTTIGSYFPLRARTSDRAVPV
jgi:hypothetical protein